MPNQQKKNNTNWNEWDTKMEEKIKKPNQISRIEHTTLWEWDKTH